MLEKRLRLNCIPAFLTCAFCVCFVYKLGQMQAFVHPDLKKSPQVMLGTREHFLNEEEDLNVNLNVSKCHCFPFNLPFLGYSVLIVITGFC